MKQYISFFIIPMLISGLFTLWLGIHTEDTVMTCIAIFYLFVISLEWRKPNQEKRK